MAGLLTLAFLKRIPWQAYAMAAALAAAYFAVTAYGSARYEAGRAFEQGQQEEAQRLQRERETPATARLEQSRREDDQAAAARQKELDDATRNLPDQAPTARQRSRACLEIRRQGGKC